MSRLSQRVFLVLALGTTIAVVSCERSPEAQKVRHLERADQYFSQQQYREAIIEYRNVIEGPQSIRYTARAGDLKPLHSRSIGKALLGALGQDELPEVLKQLPLDRVTEATITDRSALRYSEGADRLQCQ